jgi:hypothetical protein
MINERDRDLPRTCSYEEDLIMPGSKTDRPVGQMLFRRNVLVNQERIKAGLERAGCTDYYGGLFILLQ